MAATAPILLLPDTDGPHPGVVLGAEAYGVNEFIVEVGERLVSRGYAVLIPDYYDGGGPTNREAYDDFTEVVECIAQLDFTRATRRLVDGVDQLRATPGIDPTRIAVWGYCTGGTLAWLAACLRGDLAAAVLFFPSQPVFDEIGPATPVHPVDLLWQLTCPTLFIYGGKSDYVQQDYRATIAAYFPHVQYAEVPEAGHWVHAERLDDFLAALTPFLP